MTPDTEVGGPGTSDESDQPREEFSAAMVAVGAVALVGAIIWQSRSSRVSMNYLQSLSGYYIRHDIEQRMPYLLSGNTTLEGFINEYTSLAGKEDTARVRQLEASRFAILETASAERAQGLVKYLLPTMIIGAVAIAGGAALLSYTVNVGELLREDQLVVMKQQREDALKELATGELLPRTPSDVILVFPAGISKKDAWRQALGDGCILGRGSKPRKVSATLVEIRAAPKDYMGPVSGGAAGIFRVVTAKNNKCRKVVDGWVPPAWVALPPK